MSDKNDAKCSYECRDNGFDCNWYCVEDNEDAVIQKVAEHAAAAHGFKYPNKETILGNIKKPAPEELVCDITAKEEGREEDPGCAISG